MKKMDKNDMIEQIKKIMGNCGTVYEEDGRDDGFVMDGNDFDHAAEEIADEIINILSPLANRLDALAKEADERTADLPEVFDDLEDAETWNYYEGVRAAVERIRELLPEELQKETDEEKSNAATDEEKEIICRPGYHEWNLFYGDKIVFTFDDVTDELYGGNEEINDDDIEIVADGICDFHSEEIDENGINRKEVQHAIEKALGEHYGVVVI